MNTFREFWRVITGKDRAAYRSLTQRASVAYDAHQKAVDHLNKVIDAHIRVEERKKALRLREARMISHGARHMRGPFS